MVPFLSAASSASMAPSTRSAEPKLASVSYVALDAIAAGICGTPFYDTEFIVPHKGRDETLYAHSHVIKTSCPTLYRMIQKNSTLRLDSMEVQTALPSAAASTAGGDTASLTPSCITEETFADAPSEEETEYADDDDTIEEESIMSVPASTQEPSSGRVPPGVVPTRASMRGPEAPPKLSSPIHIQGSEASLPSIPKSLALIANNAARRGPESFRGASFFKSLRKKKDTIQDSEPIAELEQARLRHAEPNTPMTGTLAAPPALPRASAPPTESAEAGPRRARHASAASVQHAGRTSSRASRTTRSAGRSRPSSHGRVPGVRRVVVRGVSPRTLQALLFYLYTNQVHFVTMPHIPPHGHLNEIHEEALAHLGDGSRQNAGVWPPAFSNKAAYCLGQQLDLPDLKLRAFDSISQNMSVRSVLADLLSPFGDRFGDVQRVHLDFIMQHWDEVKTRPDFVPIVENLAHGQYPKSSASLFQLFSKLSVQP